MRCCPRAAIGQAAALQLVRVMGSAMARLADASVSAFLVNVEPGILDTDPVGLNNGMQAADLYLRADAKLAGNPLIAEMNADLAKIQQHVRPLRNQHRFGQDFATHPKNGPGARVAAPPPPLKIG